MTRLSASPLEDAMDCARQIASRSPDAIRAAKRLFVAQDNDMAATLLAESREQAAVFAGPNQREAVAANWEKRAPLFND